MVLRMRIENCIQIKFNTHGGPIDLAREEEILAGDWIIFWSVILSWVMLMMLLFLAMLRVLIIAR